MDDVVKVNAYLADLGDFAGLQRGLRRVLRRAVPGADVRAGGAAGRACSSRSRRSRAAPHERRATSSATARTPPDPQWPGGARLALSFVLNYEEGGERTPLEGDPASEAFLHEVVGAPPTVGRRNLNTESMFEYGSRAGFWRVHRIFTKHGLPLTVYAVGQALERNPEAARAMVDAGWEVASHGWRWIDYMEMPEDEEREHMRRAIEAIERVTRAAARSAGTRAGSPTTRAGSSSRRAASSTTRTRTPTSCRTGSRSPASTHLVIPYTLDANDFKFLLAERLRHRRPVLRRTSSTRSSSSTRRAGG